MTDDRGNYPHFDLEREARSYRERGERPPWERVYLDGEDITDRPELWPENATQPHRSRPARRRP